MPCDRSDCPHAPARRLRRRLKCRILYSGLPTWALPQSKASGGFESQESSKVKRVRNIETEAALDFLKQNQPMPDDDRLTEELITEYDEIRLFFIVNHDPRCIPLFLNSFGKGDGFGVYQLVEDVIAAYPVDWVVPCIDLALRSADPNIRYWCAQIAERFPVYDLIEPLQSAMQREDEGSFFALISLEHIGAPEAIASVRDFMKSVKNAELKQDIIDAMPAAYLKD